ncbi:MAG TPA: hypothetical protein VI011_02610 [Asanoa sp.]|jgi:NAD(P)H-dependent FMN reductase
MRVVVVSGSTRPGSTNSAALRTAHAALAGALTTMAMHVGLRG